MLSQFTLEGHGVRLEPLAHDHREGLAKAASGDRDSYRYTWVPDGLADARAYVEHVARRAGRRAAGPVRRPGARHRPACRGDSIP